MDIEIISKAHGNKVFHIDEEDLPIIEPYTWSLLNGRRTFYVHTTSVHPPITMHRLLMDFPEGLQVICSVLKLKGINFINQCILSEIFKSSFILG